MPDFWRYFFLPACNCQTEPSSYLGRTFTGCFFSRRRGYNCYGRVIVTAERTIKQINSLYKALSKENQYALTFWGVADADSWTRSWFKRKDWPLLYDDSYQPKPACQGFMEGLKENRTTAIE
ncbi:endo-1,4-beta-xylanase [Rhodocytophaga aerolata]|uniref:Endo-1,4-beta-xylanase n=1 Tax=Rhodocytophaga aerolata TaxID=455078 RepID=A0ABT8R994_9BACT|nr:endo-1,4-beta-xylanase [Rhodocytophaga aerolata]MDO1448666.1 endo-1,4-beta-xylanase [Rhodocytophaga aerolata]